MNYFVIIFKVFQRSFIIAISLDVKEKLEFKLHLINKHVTNNSESGEFKCLRDNLGQVY